MKFCILSVFAALALLLADAATAQIDREDALLSFKLHPDFQIELVAAEPVVFDPVDLAFDERGRPFVVEMPGYPFPEVPGRVIMLDDVDGDGFYETRKVFAEGFPVADSILPYNGGILVASPPDIIFLKDTNGDGVADVRETLLSGFTVDNPQHNFNGLTHGLDNWIYGANGGNSGNVYFLGDETNKVPLRFNDFRFDLRAMRFERTGRSAGGFGIAMDDYGRQFGTHNLEPISHLVFPGRYIEGLPGPRSGTLASIPDDEENGLVRIYPLGPQDTRVNHPEQSGYFSGSCGITFYGGGAFPEGFNGNVFIMDVVLNLVHRRVLHPDGPSFSASRGRERVEFLASTDRGFRPVNMTVAPDGSLWLLDMRRDVIEHPEWIPDELEERMDLEAGKEQGRIYRIAPKGGLLKSAPAFDRANIQDVVAALEHPNLWWRQTAQRLLVEWGDSEAVKPLEELLSSSSRPQARVHALWALTGLDALDRDALLRTLEDAHAGLRENALAIAEEVMATDVEVASAVVAMALDPDARVRMRVALAIGSELEADNREANEALMTIASKDGDDPWSRLALYSAFAKDPVTFSRRWMSLDGVAPENKQDLLGLLARVSGERAPQREIESLLALMAERAGADAALIARALEKLAEGLSTRGAGRPEVGATRGITRIVSTLSEAEELAIVRGAWSVAKALGLPRNSSQRRMLDNAKAIVADARRPATERLDYLKLLEFDALDRYDNLLYDLLGTRHPRELQAEAIDQLQRAGGRDVAERIVAMWQELGPETRVQAGDILLYKRGNNDLLLSAIEDGKIALGQLNLHLERRRVLLRSRQPGIRERAEALFSDAGVVTRREALEKMRPALDLTGDAARGKEVFAELCLKCHSMGAEGGDLGPNLGEIYRKSSETLLHDILDPNAAVNNEFVSYTIELPDGDVVSGIVANETDLAVTIRDATGKLTTVARDEMAGMYSDGLSLMPEELEVDMDVQTMADLLAYLQRPN